MCLRMDTNYKELISAFISKHRHFFIIGSASVLLLMLAGFLGGGYVLPQGDGEEYVLAPDSVSQSAALLIKAPKGISSSDFVPAAISFIPEIKGEWIESNSNKFLAYKPDDKLELGAHYQVALAVADGKIKKEFVVAEDPKVDAVFPKKDSEADEHSAITVIFNRPMVALTTLDTLKQSALPIAITPATAGKWKWTSTRNLQFLPEKTLLASAHYTVRFTAPLVSVEGLSVKTFTHTFITRPLRYEGIFGGTTSFNTPVKIAVNQPVDLDKTSAEISATNGFNTVPVIVQYGSRSVYDYKKNAYDTYIDRSRLEVIQATDSHGRKNLWDFESNYGFSIKRAYPLGGGDIILNEEKTTSVNIPPVVSAITAFSDRSPDSALERFDPAGKVYVDFYEEIDLSKTDIQMKGLKTVTYAQVCAPGEEYRNEADCKKVDSKRRVELTFDPNAFKYGEQVTLSLKHITNTNGMVANDKSLTYVFTTYPDFKIIKTTPANNASGGSLTTLTICSNTPLKTKNKENYKESLSANNYLVFSYWQQSYFVTSTFENSPCPIQTNQTSIQYGLHPETKYKLTLNLEDVFGQRQNTELIFTTIVAGQINYRIENMQKIYNVTTPEKTKLTYSTENLEYVNVSICKMRPETLLNELGGYPSQITPLNTGNCLAFKEDTIRLPKRYFVNNYFQIDIKKYFPDILGQYMVVVTHPKFRQVNYSGQLGPQIYDRTYVGVTNLAVVEKHIAWRDEYYDQSAKAARRKVPNPPEGLIWVSRTGSLEGVSGANIVLYSRTQQSWSPEGEVPKGQMTLAESSKTDNIGIARPASIKNFYGAIIASGNDATVISSWSDSLTGYRQNAEKASRTYIYTDRPIYRPGHEVFIRGIDRVGYDGSYEILKSRAVSVKVYDSQGTLIYNQERPMSQYGTFDFSVKLSEKSPLGGYRIEVLDGYGYFEVVEYVPAAFEVTASGDKEEYVSGETAQITLASKYYFGVPVDQGNVTYTITSQDYYFDRYSDEYFNFGSGWYDCYNCGYGDRFLLRGKGMLDGQGNIKISQLLDFKTLFKDDTANRSKIFVLDATVKDRNGRSVSVQKSFIVHRGSVYVGVKTDQYFIATGEKTNYHIKTVDIAGNPVSKGAISATLYKIIWKEYKRREVDGGFYYRTERTTERINEDTLSTDKNGNGSGTMRVDKEGENELAVSTVDDHGNRVETKTSLYVYGNGTIDIRSTNNETLEISAPRTSYNPGDMAEFVVKSPYTRAKALVAIERGSIMSYDIVDVSSSLHGYSFPILDSHVPNVNVSVTLLSPQPEIKYGEVNFNIGTDLRKLNIDVSSNKKTYLPGETITLSVKTTNSKGAPVPAEVSLSVVDLSVLALSGNPKKNPIVFFYDGFPVTVMTASNVKNILYEVEIPLGTKGGSGGGEDAEDLAKRSRGEFRDTAYWKASVITDASGQASITFRLPDNLTTWQVEGLGVTMDNLFGVVYRTLMARKDVMLTPLKPRFVVPGDEFSIGAKIFNQTDSSQRFNVIFSSNTLTLKDAPSTSVSIDAGKNATVYFNVVASLAKAEGTHEFVLKATAGNYEDSVKNVIPITPNETYESTATTNYTKDESASEYLYLPKEIITDRGELTVHAQATVAVFMTDALKYMATYPYGCSEQMVSKLSAIAVATRAAGTAKDANIWKPTTTTFEGKTYTINEAVKIGLDRIYQNQRPDGGFAYYPGMKDSDFYLTLHVVDGLTMLKKAGFTVDASALSRATTYILQTVSSDKYLRQSPEAIISTAYALRELPEAGNAFLSSSVASYANNRAYLNEKSSSQILAELGVLSATHYPALQEKVFSALENRVIIDSRGAYLGTNSNNNILWRSYETPAKDTALLLKAISARGTNNAILDKVVRYLVASRAGDGSWDSTNTTLASLDALTDYMLWQKENQADFSMTATLGKIGLILF